MKNLINPNWMRAAKALLVGAALTVGVVSGGTIEVQAQSRNTTTREKSEQVKPQSRNRRTREKPEQAKPQSRKTRTKEKPPQIDSPAKIQRLKQRIEALKQSDERWIQVNLSKQRLIAWEGNKVVYGAKISSGKKDTPTLTGSFRVQSKHEKARMRGEDYDRQNVPHVMYYSGSYGIHGADWHSSFGTPVSRGCVNVSPKHAKWLYDWASVGTAVVVHR